MKINQKALLALVFGFVCFQALRAEAAESNPTVTAAQKEGKFVIYSSTDSASVEPLLQDFKASIRFFRSNTTTLTPRSV